MQAHDFFSDAEEAAEDAKETVKDEAGRVTSSGPSRTGPRDNDLLGKDPIPSNTEDVTHWRDAHPRPARRTREADTVDRTRQAAEGSWESAKGQTQQAAQDVKGKSRDAAEDVKGKLRQTADDVKGKSKETKEEAKGTIRETIDSVKSKASEASEGWISWFGTFKIIMTALKQCA